jgi:2'-5' RNA ligase
VRLFLAINLPTDVRSAIGTATEDLRAAAPQLGWLAPPRLHLTLKFLGEQPAEAVEALRATLAEIAGRHRELVMELAEVGAFPNFRRARVVWLGVVQEPRLELLHHDIEVACERLGFEIDGRPFRPHLTLARVKHELYEDAARRLARAAEAVSFQTEFIVHTIDLMQSELLPAGPAYTTLASAPLRSG